MEAKSKKQFRIGWRTNLWLVPGIIVFGSLVLFVFTQIVDHAQFNGTIQLPPWVNQGGAGDCRDLVSATAGAIITTLGLVLSITVLIFSMAASQFGQRLLRRYMRDRGMQISIGIFAATFVFSLLTLLSVTARPDEREFVPWVSAWTSLILALSCVAVLIYFINHVAVLIQVNTVLPEIIEDFKRIVREQAATGGSLPVDCPLPSSGLDFVLLAPGSGYLQWVDYRRLVLAAQQAGCQIAFLQHAGRFILEGTPLAAVKLDQGASKTASPSLVEAFARAVHLGTRRTMKQDPEFAVAQIVEIGLRAMSPAVNDPFTMLSCVDALSVCLRFYLTSAEHRSIYLDASGSVRVRERHIDFTRLVAGGFDPLRQVSRDSTAATVRIFQTIASVASFARNQLDLDELQTQVELAKEGYLSSAVSRDQADVDREFHLTQQAILAAGNSLRTAK
jgi:uncharacterized membrane protein